MCIRDSNEDAWLKRCSVPQETSEQAQECAEFKSYYAGLGDEISSQVDDLDKQIASIKGNIDSIQEMVNKQDALIKKINKKIELNDANIRTIQAAITKLDGEIKQKEADIKKRNDLIKKRMIEGQATIGTNTNIEILMGASDLVDLIRKAEGLQKITESDQNEIEKLNEEKAKLDLCLLYTSRCV